MGSKRSAQQTAETSEWYAHQTEGEGDLEIGGEQL